MGTSKGYIPPTTVHWTQAKRAVSGYIKNSDAGAKENAASKFAGAMRHDMTTSREFSSAVGNILSFAKAVSQGGINNALRDFNRSDLIGKTAEEIFNELINEFTHNGSTTEDYLSAEAISSALKELNIVDMEQLKEFTPDILLKEMLIEYIKFSFAFRYEEKILMKKTPAETKELIQKMNKYISDELHSKLSLEDLKNVDFNHMHSSNIVAKALEDAYQVFETFYGED